MTKRLHMTAVIVPPPGLSAMGVKQERYSKEVSVDAAATDLAALLQTAINENVFNQYGTVVFMVQGVRIGPHDHNRCPVCEKLIDDNEVLGSCMNNNGEHRRIS